MWTKNQDEEPLDERPTVGVGWHVSVANRFNPILSTHVIGQGNVGTERVSVICELSLQTTSVY